MYQVESLENIDREYIKDTVLDFANTQRKQYVDNIAYANGNNPKIMNRALPDKSGPDNRLPVSYARRIISLVTGYMYKPGLVQYGFEDEAYQGVVGEVFNANSEPIKTAQVGKQTSIHGLGYEYHYVTGDGIHAVPRFTKLPAYEVIPIYSMDLEPEVLAFIRVVGWGEHYKLTYVTDQFSQEYVMPSQGGAPSIAGEEIPHFYGVCPLAVYQNNEEKLGDFEAVMPLIDAYDVLMSDSMNEFDRFAWAYLLLKGMMMSEENLQALRQMRVFQNLEDTGDVSFLTKEIDTEFIKFMTDLVRAEIHRQSGIPNLEDYDGAGASGKTMTKFIYLMELFTDPKESYFIEGLRQRLELVNRILTMQGKGGDPMAVNIIMNRNAPDNSIEQADIYSKFSGHISQKTLMENFADFIDNPDEELERIAEEGDLWRRVSIYGGIKSEDTDQLEDE